MATALDDHATAILEGLLETTDDMIGAVDLDKHSALTFNSALAQHLATTFGKTLRIGTRLEELFDGEYSGQWHRYFQRAAEGGAYSIEHRDLVKGRTFRLSFNRLMKDARCFGIGFSARNITPVERAVQPTSILEDRFAKLFRHSPFPLLLASADEGIIFDANHAFARLVGRERLELIGRKGTHIGLVIDPEERARFFETMRAQGRIVDFAVQYHHPDGRMLHGLVACETIRLDGVDCFLLSVADITPLHSTEQALRASELRYRAMIENAPEGIVLIDADTGRHVDANENAIRHSGFDREAFFSLSYFSIELPPQPDGTPSAETLRERIARAALGESLAFEWVHNGPDGRSSNCEVRMAPFPDPRRRLVWTSVVDIEDRKRAEREAALLRTQLEQAQRLESLGTLAGGIAHDFNNILSAIQGYAELIIMRERDPDIRSFTEEIQHGTERAQELIRQILAFSRRSPSERKPVPIAAIVKEAVKLLRVALPSKVAIVQRYPSSGWVMTDSTQIHQVVMNLGTNAGLAMQERGGTMDIEVKERDVDVQTAAQQPGLQPGRHLSLTVKDTGCGIAPENLGRIFEPFFSTRGPGRGTGLGLSVVYGIVKDAGGAILVSSELGVGTTFEILLPMCAPAAAEVAPPNVSKVVGKHRVLFVDDDPGLAKLVKLGLFELGCEVSAFTDPSQAIEEFGRRASEFDVVVTDADMPLVNGNVLAATIRRMRFDIPMILVSGAEQQDTEAAAREAGFDACLCKPYRPTMLAEIIQNVCSARSDQGGEAGSRRPSRTAPWWR